MPRRPIVRPTLITVAASIAALAAPAGAAAMSAPAPTATAAAVSSVTPAGSCRASEGGSTVRYRWASRSNAWRARTVFETQRTTSQPGMGAVNGELTHLTMHTGVQAWYLVLDARQVGGACYLYVRLPDAPTTRAGWVDRDHMQLQRQTWQIEVDLSDRRVRALRNGRAVVTSQVVIGARATPTPTTAPGQPFAMYDAKRGNPDDFTGSWQLATTALSAVDPDLGRIGLHGRGGASLLQALGTSASLGCVRMPNDIANMLVRSIGLQGLLGVPVVITR